MGAEQAWLLAAIPAGAFVVLALVGRFLPRQGDWGAVLATGSAFALFFFVLADYLDAGLVTHEAVGAITASMDWVEIGSFEIRLGTYVDPITLTMFGVITTVALMVNIFSISYMKGEPRYWWFFAVLQLFVASMLTLVMADNLLLVLVSWELVGVCSFLLIGFYWERRSAAEAAKKAFITTRVGDVGLFIGIILLWREAGTFNIQEIIHFAEEGGYSDAYLFISMAFLFLGAMGKSAQVPFHPWLPDAMEGPTPVSALIHAATMVVAGVYLTARMLPVYEVASGMMLIITIVGLTTALLTGFIAMVQTDIKRVLAYSTVSQLGFMFVALGAGSVTAGMFHLMTHAFFKAMLFLGSGSVIHATHHHQDMEELGGLWRKMPITGTTFLIGSLALAGLFPLAGFWSKDEILHAIEADHNAWAFILISFAAVLSAFYMTRLWIRTFLGEPRDRHVYEHTHESGLLMTGPLLVLCVLTIVSGFLVFKEFGDALGLPGGFPEYVYSHEGHEFEFSMELAIFSSAIAAIGIIAAVVIYRNNQTDRSAAIAAWQPGITDMLQRKLFFDDLFQFIIDRVVLTTSYVISWYDRYVVNDTGVNGSAALTGYAGSVLKYVQTGKVPNYAMAIATGVIALAIIGVATRV